MALIMLIEDVNEIANGLKSAFYAHLSLTLEFKFVTQFYNITWLGHFCGFYASSDFFMWFRGDSPWCKNASFLIGTRHLLAEC